MARRIEKIRESGRDELLAQEKELTEQIFRLRFQLSTGQAEALKRLRDAKKDLARVKTHLRAQELHGAADQRKASAAKTAEHKPAATVKAKAKEKKSAAEKPAAKDKAASKKMAGKA
jgi:large subunit ribosomal protein L29